MDIQKETKSPVVNAQKEIDDKKLEVQLELTEEQKLRLALILSKCVKAKTQRDQKRVEFDGLSYHEDYIANKNAANAYLWPKTNDDEVRVVTGTTEKKLEVVDNELASMNLQSEVIAYDQYDNELRGLGDDFNDIVKRTNEMERAEDFDVDARHELLTQRALFTMEVDSYKTINGRKPQPYSLSGPIKTDEVYIPKTIHRAKKILISGLRVYLGDINIPARNFQEQPFVIIYTRRSYAETKTIYQGWSMWKHVKPGAAGTFSFDLNPYGYRMGQLNDDEVEELKILDPLNNEYDIILNGVPMMENSTPLPYEILPDRAYPMTMTIIKAMDTDFAYGKSPVASAKTLQALNDETIRNLVRKFRQALEPPLGIPGEDGRVYSRDIWEPGAVTQGISSDDFSILNPENKGVTQSEFSLYSLIEKKTEEFIGAGALQAGIAESGDQTATEIQTLQRNAVKNLGHIVAAYMRYKRDITYQRIYNIIENFTLPVKKEIDQTGQVVQDVFEKFTINNAKFSDGTKGKKIVQFIDREITEDEKQAMYEYELSEKASGRPTKIRVINKTLLLKMPIFWYVTVNQQQREGSALSRVMFQDTLKQAQGISEMTGRPINPDKIIEEFESRWQFKDMFSREAPQTPMNSEVNQQELKALGEQIGMHERTAAGQGIMEGVKGSIQRPSLSEINKE